MILTAVLACAQAALAAPPAARTVVATVDPALGVRIVSEQRLVYRLGADGRSDRPVHVRAASGLAWYGDQLAIAQDDAGFVGLWDPGTRRVEFVALPAGRGGRRQFDGLRGNKGEKLDLESAAAVRGAGGDALVLFGSGSTPVRDVVVRVDGSGARVHRASALFDALRASRELGSELNIEGAVVIDSGVRLFQRGNGAPRSGVQPVDASIDVSWPALVSGVDLETSAPVLGQVLKYDLGRVGGVRLTFTDAAAGAGGQVLYLASAEDSPDAVRDGPVAGSVVGVTDEEGKARHALLCDRRGRRLAYKLEGIALDRARRDRIYLVADPDDPVRPAVLITAELTGPWWR